MKLTPGIKNAFARNAGDGVHLEGITEADGETKFTAWVAHLGKSITVGCSGHLTPKQAEAEAGRVAAYLAALTPKSAPRRDRMELANVDQ